MAETAEPWLQEPFTATPKALLQATEKNNDEENVEVFFRRVDYRFDAEGRQVYEMYQVYKILTELGVDGWDGTSKTWAPWHQDRPQIEARVITAGGQVHILDPKTLSESPEADASDEIYSDRLRLQAPLPAVEVGSIIEERIILRDREPFFATGSTHRYALGSWAPIHHLRITLETPEGTPLHHQLRRMAEDTEHRLTEVLENGQRKVVFEQRDVPSWEVYDFEPGIPYDQSTLPILAFSVGESWQQLATEYSQVVDARIAEAAPTAALARLPKTFSNPMERMVQALAELQNQVRYTGLELGAASLIPVSPGEVLKRKYGDCKDQATMLVAMLRAEKIPAYVALLNAGFGNDVEPDLPGLGLFNHAIVYVPASPATDDKAIWIDPTDPFARVGELPAADQNRWALIAAPATEALVRTPSSTSNENRSVKEREIFLADYGSGRAIEENLYFGSPEHIQRYQHHNQDTETIEDNLSSYISDQFLSEELGSWQASDTEDLSQPFSIQFEALEAGRVVSDLEEAVVAILHGSMLSNLPDALLEEPADDETRTNDYYFRSPYRAEWTYRIHPASGFVIRDLPENETRRFGTATLEQRFTEEDGVVRIDLQFDTGKRLQTAEEFTATREAILDFAQEDALLIYFDHQPTRLLAEGQAVEAIQKFDDLVTAEPTKAIHLIRMARGLISIGLGEAAIEYARKATEVEPESSLAYWNLGFLQQYDAIGRRFGKGFDYDQAVADLRRAVELDPEDDLPRVELGILLDHNRFGMQYGPGARLDEAIETYQELRETFESSDYDVNLMVALWRTERFDDLLALIEEAEPTDVSQMLEVAAVAAKKGASPALRRAKALQRDQEGYAQLIGNAVQNLMLIGRFEESAELFKRLAPQSENPAALSSMIDLLSRIRPADKLKLSDDDPEAIIKRMFMALMAEDLKFESLHELVHDPLGEDEEIMSMDPLEFRNMMVAQAGGMQVNAFLDFLLAALEISQDGDEKNGYRLRVHISVGGEQIKLDAYLSKIDGRLKIVEFGESSGLALEVLRRIELGELEAARQWLDWYREDLEKVEREDPYALPAFPRLWTIGQKADAETMRRAAASLLFEEEKGAEIAVPILQNAIEAGHEDDSVQAALEAALMESYATVEDMSSLYALASRLIEKTPDSDALLRYTSHSGIREGHLDEVEALVRKRLDKKPNSEDAHRVLVEVFERKKNWQEANAQLETLIDRLPESIEGHNGLAWNLLFVAQTAEDPEPIVQRSLDLAVRSAELSQYRRYSALHTVASVFAELGRVGEAYRVLLQAMTVIGQEEPQGPDWYVLGRIAEALGLTADARTLYEKVEKREHEHPMSSYALAQIRLGKIDL